MAVERLQKEEECLLPVMAQYSLVNTANMFCIQLLPTIANKVITQFLINSKTQT